MIEISKDDIKEAVAENGTMESDSERDPEMVLRAPGFNASIELDDSKSFEHAVQLLDTLKQKEHGEPLDLDTEAETEVSEEETISTVEDSLEEIRESVQDLNSRTSDLEDQVDSIRPVEEQDTVDPSRIDELEDTLQQIVEKTESLEDSVSELEERPEPEPEEPEEVDEGVAVDEEDETEEQVECPQCEDEFDSPRALSTHTSRSGDHTGITEHFQNEDGELECPECGHTSNNSDAFSVHFSDSHDTGMVQYYVDHFDELDLPEEPEPDQEPEPEPEDTEEEPEEESDEEDEFDADTVPDLIDQQVVEPEPPYTYSRFKQLDKIEQAAALYLAGKEIREGDAADYADKLLTTTVDSTSDKEAQYIYQLVNGDMSQYFEKDTDTNSFGREITVYRHKEALPSGVEELQIQDWTADEFEDLPDIAVSEIVLEAVNKIGPASLEAVEGYVYADGEDPNLQIKRVLDDYLDEWLNVQWENGEKKYSVKDEISEKLEDERLSLYQASQKNVSGRKQYICEDCDEPFDESQEAKKHRRNTGHLNWDKRNRLPWRGEKQEVEVTA